MMTATENAKPIVYLCCCVCGAGTKGRQWWNRDNGYGLCESCDRRLDGREIVNGYSRLYGTRGVHFSVDARADEVGS